jgi:hypothetical protein
MTPRPVIRLRDPRTDAFAELVANWREAATTLRRYGDTRGADLIDLLAGEAEGALRDAGIAAVRRSKTVERNTEPDRLLTVAETALRLGVSPSWVHRHWRDALGGCARKLGTRTLRFSSRRLEEHVQGGPSPAT